VGTLAIGALRVVIALALAGSLGVQVVLMPIVWADLEGTDAAPRATFIALVVLGIVTLQISAVCVWRLLTLVRRESVFSAAAFKFVDVVIGSTVAAAVIAFAIAVLLALGEAAPGVVGLICGLSLVIAGVALLIFVLRALLTQAVSRDTEARFLRSELDEVI